MRLGVIILLLLISGCSRETCSYTGGSIAAHPAEVKQNDFGTQAIDAYVKYYEAKGGCFNIKKS